MSHKTWVPKITLGMGLATLGLGAVAADGSDTPTSTLQSVVIMGEKAERSIKETTSSVAVISEDKLSGMRYKTLREAVSEINNVVTLSGSVPDIRGVSGNGSAGGFNSISGGAKARVSTLIDGVAEPFVADLTGDSGLWDIEQIEVFRGPQSTSNGRNSIGGSIVIKTKDPSFDWEAAGRLGYRTQAQYIDTSAMISGPILEDTLAFRIAAQRLDGETLTNDAQAFESNPPSYDLNELISEKVRAKLLLTPTDQLRTLFAYSSIRRYRSYLLCWRGYQGPRPDMQRGSKIPP
ncbi:hypothetical protein OLMES_1283 [Oleiphilus messinensis]|uniref:TonB-dependent receptor plug domain-containing protein n=1 Tax=Oleiphilus messinensis TaxID=141451 RepID=A0A1Y0I4F3_9GAMM|nr:TonB-dependent receptor plug domain-containing protein [Oleiphilus messinensis]ARU55362.1 hypothetical protein OLMES_1283 [Oleiphilus messinensis]